MGNTEDKDKTVSTGSAKPAASDSGPDTVVTGSPKSKVVASIITEKWMADRSDLELSELIVLASSELVKRKSSPTERMGSEGTPISFVEPSKIPLSEYITVPRTKDTGDLAKAKTWHIVFISANKEHKPIPLKIVGDTVLGRKTSETGPEIDLRPFDADGLGVSRTHALLRPKADQLLLSDLGSTNGTLLNGEKLQLGRAGRVADQSVISMGQLHFQVRIIHRPGETETETNGVKDALIKRAVEVAKDAEAKKDIENKKDDGATKPDEASKKDGK